MCPLVLTCAARPFFTWVVGAADPSSGSERGLFEKSPFSRDSRDCRDFRELLDGGK